VTSLECRVKNFHFKFVSRNSRLASRNSFIMFEFEKLTVYTKAKSFNKEVNTFLTTRTLDSTTHHQLRRASFSIMLNIAEGSGRSTNKDKRHFFVMSRGSAFECVAIFDYLKDIGVMTEVDFKKYYQLLDELSRMLYGMIKSLSK